MNMKKDSNPGFIFCQEAEFLHLCSCTFWKNKLKRDNNINVYLANTKKMKSIPFGKYFLLKKINVGGMAEVYLAKARGVEGFEKLVAIKRILPNIAEDKDFIQMFIDEAKIAGHLTHANIAQIYDLGKIGDHFFIAMEYIHGKDVRAIFKTMRVQNKLVPIPIIVHIITKVAEGLEYAHKKKDSNDHQLGIVHRDISPQNILVSYEGDIKIIDFGIAKAAIKASKTQAGILKGKFGYMSPEQVRGLPLDGRSDIFALGIIFYELLTNERLFIGKSDFSTLEKVRNVEVCPPSAFNQQIPKELERIVLKGLAKEPGDRYNTAIDMANDLQRYMISFNMVTTGSDLTDFMRQLFAKDLAKDKKEENVSLETLESSVDNTSQEQGMDKDQFHQDATQIANEQSTKEPISTSSSQEKRERISKTKRSPISRVNITQTNITVQKPRIFKETNYFSWGWVFAALLLIVVIAAFSLNFLRSEARSLIITTFPADAEIWINDKLEASSSPCVIKNVVAGEYFIKVKHYDYWDYSKKIVIDEITSIDPLPVFLEKKRNGILVITAPKRGLHKAKIKIDKQGMDVTNPYFFSHKNLSNDSHQIEIKKRGFKKMVKTITIKAGETTYLPVALIPLRKDSRYKR